MSTDFSTITHRLIYRFIIVSTGLCISSPSFATDNCADYLQGQSRLLHSANTINVCEAFTNKPLLVVNTASHCGFTGQFKGLEALHQQYKDRGLVVIGVPSNDFKQGASSEEKAAGVCFENYGVSFTMLAPTKVTGQSAHRLFKGINQQSEPPSWNFTKYLIDKNGVVVERFATPVLPQSDMIKKAIEQLLIIPPIQ